MKKAFNVPILGTLAIVVALVVVPAADAQCVYPAWSKTEAIAPQASRGAGEQRPSGKVVPSSEKEAASGRIDGFWKVKFVSEGTPGIPDGVVIDNGFAQWHSDGTEIMNSSRAPATQSFCLGVFEKSGPSSYDLNHFALSFDPAGNFVGPARIQEHVTLNRSADQYEGSLIIDQYDSTGGLLIHITGSVTATRITVDTTIADIF